MEEGLALGANEIADVFNTLFAGAFHVRMAGGGDEPTYTVFCDGLSLLRFREDYPASALHEVAHWCIAGKRRRNQNDFGYHYEANRNLAQQAEFQRLEVRPQGLEWIFCEAAGIDFRVSVDNFEVSTNINRFRESVRAAAQAWLRDGLPTRASTFADALARRSGNLSFAMPSHYRELPG